MGRGLETLNEFFFDICLDAEIKRAYGDRGWTGKDGKTAQDITLYPNTPTVVEGEGEWITNSDGYLVSSNPSTEVSVLLTPETIPPLLALRFLPDSATLPVDGPILDYMLSEGQHALFSTSTKSRFAMLGVEVSDWQDIPASTWRKIARGNTVETPIRVNSYVSRPVTISSGTPLFRYFSPLRAPCLEGEELVQAQQDGLIEVDGAQGETWQWVSSNIDDPQGSINPQDIFGMRIKLKPDLKWIPPSDKPIRMEDFQGPDYRNKIDALLEPVPYIDDHVLCISETYPLSLASSVSGYISLNTQGAWGRQINSRYIDPLSNWGIRVEEILSPNQVRGEERDMLIHYFKSE